MNTFIAIDIGSNAIRTVITQKSTSGRFTVLEKQRISLRLGSDVFKMGYITDEKINNMLDIFKRINDLISKLPSPKTRACATSAMRDANNGKEIIELIKLKTGIIIELIDGDTEARLIHDAVQSELHLDHKLALIVDIGGGSTEFTISENGKLTACKSFNIGAVRLLEYADFITLNNKITNQLNEAYLFINSVIGNRKIEALVGTGGNFRRLGKINRKLSEKSFVNYLTASEVNNVFFELNKLNHDERVKKFDLSDDRADVIIPAALIIKYLTTTLESAGIYIPKVGLKEGILLSIYANH